MTKSAVCHKLVQYKVLIFVPPRVEAVFTFSRTSCTLPVLVVQLLCEVDDNLIAVAIGEYLK